ncbi:MAG: flagellar hook-associated protein FlgK [Hyphomicrobiales bacterium]|nr:flagellar hook-associated protein FlgK [Hyphomicrobiales bacterium]
MSLQTALYAARSALAVNSTQTSTVSRNIAGINQSGYARRLVLVETNGTEVQSAGVDRATDLALRNAMLAATSSSSADSAINSALTSLQQSVGDPSSGTSPASLISGLNSALVQAAASPQNPASLGAAVDAAKSLAGALNSASAQVQSTRTLADAAMSQSVSTINSLLQKFSAANNSIVAGEKSGADVSDALDRRDALLTSLAQQIGIKTVSGPGGDTAIYTDNGATLFQGGAAREVSMTPTTTLSPGVAGNAVYVDGAPITGKGAGAPLQGGALAGLSTIRDVTSQTYQTQLDEIARGLINATSQSDQTGGGAAPRTGLFTWSGAPSTPSGPTNGVAAQIKVDPTVDPASGGNVNLLRDGGIGAGASAYVSNPTGAASYNAGLQHLADSLGGAQSFDPSSAIAAQSSVADFATNSVAWLEAARQAASTASTQSSTFASQATSALSNATGVNIDDQMSQMLALENSYQASAKMIGAVDTMYNSLFTSLG